MNKTEIAIVAVLFALLLGWGFMTRRDAASRPPVPAPDPTAAKVDIAPGEKVEPLSVASADPPPAMVSSNEDSAPVVVPAAEPPVAEPRVPEQVFTLSNDVATLTVSSWGAAIRDARFTRYRESLAPESPPVRLDFTDCPALSLSGIPGLTGRDTFDVETREDGRAIRLTARTSGGLFLTREIQMTNGYQVMVSDVFSNAASAVLVVPDYQVALGPMPQHSTQIRKDESMFLGLDSLAEHGGERVRHWMATGIFSKSPVLKQFESERTAEGERPKRVVVPMRQPLSWIAAKNKFFVQILAPEPASDGVEWIAERGPSEGRTELARVWGRLVMPGLSLEPGQGSERRFSYYIGSKEYSQIRALGRHQDEVMEFGTWFGWICKLLLPLLNAIHSVLPNYGVAIILLTLIVRLVFWPVTHKSNESMKKMQKLQPLVAELRKKFKDKPQKMNQEVMALYREHKVSPMAGCLPMAVQIPVFIALYTVLRSAVELRFAPFLWISDLSAPEGLLAGVLPIPLNILPLFMTATAFWQQKLTPAAGDPQQQKMMAFMPVVMLFFFYNLASALVLYWSVSQCIAIVQLLWQRRRSAMAEAAVPVAEVLPPRKRGGNR